MTREAMADPGRILRERASWAEAHLRTWVEGVQMPDGPALA